MDKENTTIMEGSPPPPNSMHNMMVPDQTIGSMVMILFYIIDARK